MVLGIGYTLRIRKRSSCLHKDSYMAQRKERTLGYEGRYRRTLSPSGLGSNNGSKSSLESTSSPSASESVGPARSTSNMATGGKLDSTLSPSAWEKFHNIRPPSTTVIFTSHELSKAVGGSPPTTLTTSGTTTTLQPPMPQPLFHRSISCDSNIFNNKTGASQSSIPPPVAQVAPLRGLTTTTISNNNGMENGFDKGSQSSLRNDANVFSGGREVNYSTNGLSPVPTHLGAKPYYESECYPIRDNNPNGVTTSIDIGDKDERFFRDPAGCQPLGTTSKRELTEQSEQTASRNGMGFSNSILPSVIVPPLQYERCEKDGGIPHHHENHTVLKKSEVSLRVNCTSVVALQADLMNGNVQSDKDSIRADSGSPFNSQSESGSAVPFSPSPTMRKGCDSPPVNNCNSTASFYTGRQKTQEELECEELSRDIAKQLPQGDKLQSLLVPLPDHKTTADYMEGLFHLELKLQPETLERQDKVATDVIHTAASPEQIKLISHPVQPASTESASQIQKTATAIGNGLERSEGNEKMFSEGHGPVKNSEYSHNETISRTNVDNALTPLIISSVLDAKAATNEANTKTQQNAVLAASYRRCNGHAPLPADSAYFTTSESKAKFLTQYNKDIKKEPISGTDCEELDKQKEELVSRISRKLEILRTEQLMLREEIQSNEQLGQMVVERVKQTAKRNEFDKFKLHVEEIEKITSLLLGISGRLARAENALMGLSDPPNPQEKKILESKRDKLREQLDEAKILKENIDRRSAQVSSFLQKYLSAEEYADYDHFVKMKAKLIIDARDVDDKIKLGEEQLGALKDALNTTLSISSCNSSS